MLYDKLTLSSGSCISNIIVIHLINDIATQRNYNRRRVTTLLSTLLFTYLFMYLIGLLTIINYYQVIVLIIDLKS